MLSNYRTLKASSIISNALFGLFDDEPKLSNNLGDFINLLDFIPPDLQPGIKARTGSIPLQTYVSNAIKNIQRRGGGTLYVPEGLYVGDYSTDAGSGFFNLERVSNVHVIGAGRGATVLKAADGADCQVVAMVQAQRCSIRSLTVDGNRGHTADNSRHGIRADGDYLRVEDVNVQNTGSYGIGIGQANHARYCTLEDVWTENTGNDGIDIKDKDWTSKGNSLTRIWVKSFNLNEFAEQAGVDVRGAVSLSHIFVEDVGGSDTGIRFRFGEINEPNGVGGHRSTLSNFQVIGKPYADGDTSVGLDLSGRYIGVESGVVNGCRDGLAINDADCSVAAIKAVGFQEHGFRALQTSDMVTRASGGTVITSCHAISTQGTGFQIAANDVALVSPTARGCTTGIEVVDGITGVSISSPRLSHNVSDLRDLGVGTAVSWDAYANVVFVSLTGTTAQTELMRYVAGARMLSVGSIFHIRAGGTVSGASGAKIIQWDINGTMIDISVQEAAETQRWAAELHITVVSDTEWQVISDVHEAGGASASQLLSLQRETSHTTTIRCVATLGSAADTVTQEYMLISRER